jgi:hypothetical protein
MRSASRYVSTAFMFGVGLSIMAIATSATACAVCVGSSPADQGYFWGILFLMSMPFTVGGAVGGWLVYAYCRRPRPAFTTAAAAIPKRHFIRQLLARRRVDRRDDGPPRNLEQSLGSTAEVWTPR